MTPGNPSSVEEHQIVHRFESLGKILRSETHAAHRRTRLVLWALPSDRRLPLVFMGLRLGELIETPFVELANTPGVGRKKIHSLLNLLARAAQTHPDELPGALPSVAGNGHASVGDATSEDVFDPSGVSEVVWSKWRATVIERRLESETLGRLAPSLRRLTQVAWSVPMGEYSRRSLLEIREMKTHGEKRLRSILEVFHRVHALVAGMGDHPELIVRIVPKQIDRAERWVRRVLQRSGIPPMITIQEAFVEPLLEQIRADAGEQVVQLAGTRLGHDGPITSVRQVARQMGVTRARVYQLLNEINDILTTRWPDGRHPVYCLRDKLIAEAEQMPTPPDLTPFLAAVELFYPASRRGADGSLESDRS